jgi:hypothetical protein
MSTIDVGPTEKNVRALQLYSKQVGRLADALSKDGALTERVITASQHNEPAQVERMFKEVGVESKVAITGAGKVGTAGEQADLVHVVTVTIGVGPVSVSFHCECGTK